MTTIAATELKTRLGKYLDDALSNPVLIHRNGQPSHVILRYEDYERLSKLEDAYWSAKAKEAEESGKFLGPEKSMKVLQNMIREKQAEDATQSSRKSR